jgi:hypothetical protein
MAVEIGTATGYLDLLDKLRIFATGLAGGEAWTVLRWVHDSEDNGHELVLQGPGLAELDEIMVGIKTYRSVTNDYYNWKLQGYAGFLSAMAFDTQPGAIPTSGNTPRVCLWPNSIPYWFVGSGRRLIVVAKISTVYQACYLGFLRPYGTPGQYPYPLVVGGSSCVLAGERWSVQSGDVRHFTNPGGQIVIGAPPSASTLCLRTPGGVWGRFLNNYRPSYNVWPYYGANIQRTVPIELFREGLDGSYPYLPLVLTCTLFTGDCYGELDGCYYISGFNNAAENIVEDGANTLLVVQNVYLTSAGNYWLLKLE